MLVVVIVACRNKRLTENGCVEKKETLMKNGSVEKGRGAQ
jgi:hypothetical protein